MAFLSVLLLSFFSWEDTFLIVRLLYYYSLPVASELVFDINSNLNQQSS